MEFDRPKGQILYTVGLPRSGKSTIADRMAAKGPGRVVVSADDFRQALYQQPFIPTMESLIH